LTKRWVSLKIRNEVIDYMKHYMANTELPRSLFLKWLGISKSKYYSWCARVEKESSHNGMIPKRFWLREWEKQAIIAYYLGHQGEGYRRVSYMMLDANIVAVSPSSTYRVLVEAGLMRKWNRKESKKGTGFHQPSAPHRHWHVDVSYLNICGTFYFFCSVLDGYSRAIVHWDIGESMEESAIELIIQQAREKHPGTTPRIISDNGPQFIANDFKSYIKLCGMTHVRTSPYYPQSNGKIERFHATYKQECIRPKTPLSLEDTKRMTTIFMDNYNNTRLHSAIGYVPPMDKMKGNEGAIFAARKRKLQLAKELRETALGKVHSAASLPHDVALAEAC